MNEFLNEIYKKGLGEINNILNNYDYEDLLVAVRLNARYKELTGENHEIFLKEVPDIIRKKLIYKNASLKYDYYDTEYYELLERIHNNIYNQQNGIRIVEHPHAITKYEKIINNIDGASYDDVLELLEVYNKDKMMVLGKIYIPFRDPIVATKLNTRYKQLTGENNLNYMQETPKIIMGLLTNKDKLIRCRYHDEEYFRTLEGIKNNILKMNINIDKEYDNEEINLGK